jgi:beta-1,4-mannosyl-glycoprotein beta-1,4-N-acetylglucosaminyltransferase
MPTVKVYDCFLFFDEFEQLEIRLNELNHVVDKFILCEGTRTFCREKKDLLFERNKERFAPFLDRIIHLVFDDGPVPIKEKFAFEREQRDYLLSGINWRKIQPEDIVLISDVDEIPSAEAVKRFYKDKQDYITFRQSHYLYKLNLLLSKRLNGPVAFRWYALGPQSLTQMREKRRHTPRYGGAGWHFSCLGGSGRLENKILAYSHRDINEKHIPNLDHKISNNLCYYNDKQLQPVPIDATFPLYVRENMERFKEYIYVGS